MGEHKQAVESTELFTSAEIERIAQQLPGLLHVRGWIALGERMWDEGSRGKRRAIIMNYVRKKHRAAVQYEDRRRAMSAAWQAWRERRSSARKPIPL